MQKKEKIAQS